jgi:hypothetical protein
MAGASPRRQLDEFLSKYTPEIAAEARAAHRRLRALIPGAVEMVYDNYNALVIGFGPSERASEAIVSIALYPRWVSLFFLHGVGLPDPQRLLTGGGRQVRQIRLKGAEQLDEPAVRDLIAAAVARSAVPPDPSRRNRLVIKSISEAQRPRRPAKAGQSPKPRSCPAGRKPS